MAGLKVRKGDTVQVISGKDKGVKGKVIKTLPEQNRVIVEGVNRVKRHTKPGQGAGGARTGGIIVRTDGTAYTGTRGVRVSVRSGKDIS